MQAKRSTQVTRLLLIEILDNLLKFIEEHYERPPATHPLDNI